MFINRDPVMVYCVCGYRLLYIYLYIYVDIYIYIYIYIYLQIYLQRHFCNFDQHYADDIKDMFSVSDKYIYLDHESDNYFINLFIII